MLRKLWKSYRTYKDARSIAGDPEEFVVASVQGALLGYFGTFIVTVFVILGGLALFGFSAIWGGPYAFARVLFWIMLFVILGISTIIVSLWKRFRDFIQPNKKSNRKNNNIIDITPDA